MIGSPERSRRPRRNLNKGWDHGDLKIVQLEDVMGVSLSLSFNYFCVCRHLKIVQVETDIKVRKIESLCILVPARIQT